MNRFITCLVLLISALISCKSDSDISAIIDPIEVSSRPNIMLIIVDDMGLDASPGYDVGNIKPTMPNLQNLINTGIRFNNIWSNPTCSPTRASILTGKYGFRTGVTKPGDELSETEVSLQKYLDNTTASSYNHAVIGKWHLSNNPLHPNTIGINHYSGFLSGTVNTYWDWNLVENGTTSVSTEYTTTKFTDLAIKWIDDQTKPWFLWLAYNAPHTPFHLPPDNLHNQGTLPTDQASINANPLPYYMAMLEAMDTEFGRLMDTMSQEQKDNTIFIFIGDNGTPAQVVQDYNNRRAKGTVYQGGINVPMVISGKNVTRINQTEDALLNTTDLFATIAEIAGANTPEINDSKSFKDLLTDTDASKRDYVYSEIGSDTGGSDYTIRNNTHKYIMFSDGSEALFDLIENPLENPNLLNTNQLPLSEANSAIKNDLMSKLIEIRN